MAPQDFLRLLYNARCLVGNSSVGIRECAFLGEPVVNIGSRQSGRERGRNVIDVDYSTDKILAAARQQCRVGHHPSDPIYGDGTAGKQIADVLSTCRLQIEKKIQY
jgi:UDP-N-acetylglucosamine 2-epimerase